MLWSQASYPHAKFELMRAPFVFESEATAPSAGVKIFMMRFTPEFCDSWLVCTCGGGIYLETSESAQLLNTAKAG